jgi:hypothetical protein
MEIIRTQVGKKVGSGICDKHPGFATLLVRIRKPVDDLLEGVLGPCVAPHDGRVQGLPAHTVPHNGRLPLVGNTFIQATFYRYYFQAKCTGAESSLDQYRIYHSSFKERSWLKRHSLVEK